jgi:DNA-binding response OmpR family regulator
MSLQILAVSDDAYGTSEFQALWQKYSISFVRAESMQEAMGMLGKESFLFTKIITDSLICTFMLGLMRELSPAPIFVFTPNFTLNEYVDAVSYGADGYAPFNGNVEDCVRTALALLKRCSSRSDRQSETARVIIRDDLIIQPAYKKVYRNNTEIKLSAIEFDLLYMFINKCGIVFSPEQIYKEVWGLQYDDSAKAVIWTQVKRLRQKLRTEPKMGDCIKTIREVGYYYALQQ